MSNPSPNRRRWMFLLTGILLLCLGYTLFAPDDSVKGVTYSQFMAEVESGTVKKAVVDEGNRRLEGTLADGKKISSKYVGEENIAESLRAKKVDVDVRTGGSTLGSVLLSLLPMILFILLIVFGLRWMMRSMSPRNQAGLFTGSKAKRIDAEKVVTRFSDVLGAAEAVESARELVDFLKDPARFVRMGGEPPKGILFMGPPGTGKSLLARAVAGEAGVPFFSISGSEFVEMFVGVGAARVRSMMEEARKSQPCIIFIDEIDAVGRHRGSGIGNTHDEREQTLNQLLVELDGFDKSTSIMLIAATNRPDVLDPALMRRFGRKIVMPLPDLLGRIAILGLYGQKVRLDPAANLRALGAMTTGLSGDDLAKLVNEAALLAGRHGHDMVLQADLEEAFEKVVLGAERPLCMSDKEKRKTAVHESGHTLMALKAEDGQQFHKVTIVPRGRALGVTWSLASEDVVGRSERELLASVEVLLGGRAAEMVVFGESSTGASNDLQRATELLREMIERYGMSEQLGPAAFGAHAGPMFLGRDLVEHRRTSEETARQIEMEIVKILRRRDESVQRDLKKQRVELDVVTEALLKYETLTSAQVRKIVDSLAPYKGAVPEREQIEEIIASIG